MRVLFIGNSHTYANAMPFMVRGMLDARRGEASSVWAATCGGRNLAWHAAEPGTQQAIRMHDWDFIVLQQQTHPFAGYEQLAADCQALSKHLRSAGAAVVLYATWKSRVGPQSEQDVLNEAFDRVGRERGWPVAPVGQAWRLASQRDPNIELYAPDGEHASPAGSYLAACAIFATITGQSPLGLPGRIESHGHLLIDLDPAARDALQWAAEQCIVCRASPGGPG